VKWWTRRSPIGTKSSTGYDVSTSHAEPRELTKTGSAGPAAISIQYAMSLAMREDVGQRSHRKLREPAMEICRRKSQIHGVHCNRRTHLTCAIRPDRSKYGSEQTQHGTRDMSWRRRAPRSALQACCKLVERHVLRAADLKRRTTR